MNAWPVTACDHWRASSRSGLSHRRCIAVHALGLEDAELELIRRAGPGIALCLAADLARGDGLPPHRGAGRRAPRGPAPQPRDEGAAAPAQDLWTDIKLLALHGRIASRSRCSAHEVLEAATRGGAAALGLDTEIGTLEAGKWADLCCLDLGGPAMQPALEPLSQVLLAGGRDLVSDVWVAGRQLLVRGTVHAPRLAGARRALESGRRARARMAPA